MGRIADKTALNPDVHDSAPRTPPSVRKTCPTLVLGIGNILLRDEGVGVRVVEALARMELPPDVEVVDGGTAGLDLLEVLADRRKVIVIDAVEGNLEPGTVMRLGGADFVPRGGQSVSLHDIGLLETLLVARQLGIAPQEVVVFGIKPKEAGCGLALSPEVERVVPRVIESVLAEVAQESEGCA
ncbi:MAG: HyaD/HybD family hydrogenase maturation endopeptidase [Planctomycetota bacterium]